MCIYMYWLYMYIDICVYCVFVDIMYIVVFIGKLLVKILLLVIGNILVDICVWLGFFDSIFDVFFVCSVYVFN